MFCLVIVKAVENSGWNVQSWLTLIAVSISAAGFIYTIISPILEERRIKKEANKHMEYLDSAIEYLKEAKNQLNPWGTTIDKLILAKSSYISFAIVSKSHGVNVETDPIEKQIDAFLALGAKAPDDNPIVYFKEDTIGSMVESLTNLRDSYE